MSEITNRRNCNDWNKMDLVDFLEGLGHTPQKVSGNDHWYLSPLRDERTASFKVNRRINKWYDHGMGKGGGLIDFACLYFKCTVKDFLHRDDRTFSFQPPKNPAPCTSTQEHTIEILHTSPITSTALLFYLKERRISYKVAAQYSCEAAYVLRGREYRALAFKNDRGGFELRNAYFKGSSSPKSPTTISKGHSRIAVFEGFFDFLSFVEIGLKAGFEPTDFLILNSLSFAANLHALPNEYQEINLFLDNDVAGQDCSQILTASNSKFINRNWLYRNHEDLNDWLVHFGKNDPPP